MKFPFRDRPRFGEILRRYFSFRNETRSLDPLYDVFQSVKRQDFTVVLEFLRNSPEVTENFGYYIRNLFQKRPFNLSLTEANILSENSFVNEFKKRLLNKILPGVENENSVWFLVDYLSVTPVNDLRFFRNIPEDDLSELFSLLQISEFISQKSVRNELLFSANLLAWRAIGTAMEADVMNMVPEYRNYDNPFLALQDEMDELIAQFRKKPEIVLTSKNEHYKQINIYLRQCLDFVERAFKNSSKYGISGKINQSLLKIRQQIMRISDIINLLVVDDERDLHLKSKQLFFNILEYKSHKNNVSELFNDSTRLMSHLITNHTAETGSHYISSTRKEYLKMFWKASGGGVIVGVLCVLKILYSYIPASEFGHAFLYAFNYAMGFIMIYLMGFTLATKQPAMTAATMAKVLSDEKNTRSNYIDFAHLVSKLFRSQFIAFVGNVLWAFPVSLAVIYGLDVIFNDNLASEKSTQLLHDLDPVRSKALLHASIAGFYLFISGIISGNVGNSSVYYHIPKRIAKNPMIKQVFGEKAAVSISAYYSKNWAGIISNFWFGIFLGVTGTVGAFLGLDIDIRHITFAAGNLALGLYGKEFSVDNMTLIISITTVFLIGFFNFLVSFGLSIYLALRSRKITMGETREIIREINRYFLRNPLRFFIPITSAELDGRAKELIKSTNSTGAEDR